MIDVSETEEPGGVVFAIVFAISAAVAGTILAGSVVLALTPF